MNNWWTHAIAKLSQAERLWYDIIFLYNPSSLKTVDVDKTN